MRGALRSAVVVLMLGAATLTPAGSSAAAVPPIDPVSAAVETEPVFHSGDAMDDPAIWVHPTNPAQSLVLGNDKLGGLETYDLQGNRVQRLTDPEISFWGNVDVRHDITIGGVTRDLVGVSHRRIQLYTVNPSTRQLSSVTDGVAVGALGEGFCFYNNNATDTLYAITITRGGRLRQFEIHDADGDDLLQARLVRDIQVGSEAEGCVADDRTGDLYVSQEDVALWRYDADPGGGAARVAVDTATPGGRLAPDIEGVTLVNLAGSGGYLLASAQRVTDSENSYFAAYQRTGGNAFVSAFRVTGGAAADDCDRTDGITAYAGSLGPAFPEGVFICQDHDNDAPGVGNQDFKLVPLQNVVDLTPGGNAGPTAAFTSTCGVRSCEFDGTSSTDSDGTIEEHSWDFGDGSGEVLGAQPQHTYAEAGSYPVTLTVTDNAGGTDSTTSTVTVGTTAGPIGFEGASTANRNATSIGVTVPSGVGAGDALLLFWSTNQNVTPASGPGPGWTQVHRNTDAEHTTTVWQRTAAAGDAGDAVTVTTATRVKSALTLAAYSGTAASPVAHFAAAGQPGTSAQHTTPTVMNTVTGGWRLSYWAAKSAAITAFTPPAGETSRGATNGDGSGRITTLLTDAGNPVGTGSQGGRTATTDAATGKATYWTLILRPG